MDYSEIDSYYPYKEINGDYFGMIIISTCGLEAEQHFNWIIDNKLMHDLDFSDFVNFDSPIERINRGEVMYFK